MTASHTHPSVPPPGARVWGSGAAHVHSHSGTAMDIGTRTSGASRGGLRTGRPWAAGRECGDRTSTHVHVDDSEIKIRRAYLCCFFSRYCNTMTTTRRALRPRILHVCSGSQFTQAPRSPRSHHQSEERKLQYGVWMERKRNDANERVLLLARLSNDPTMRLV